MNIAVGHCAVGRAQFLNNYKHMLLPLLIDNKRYFSTHDLVLF